jgi:hypothetical protein
MQIKVWCLSYTLPKSAALPSAWSTRQKGLDEQYIGKGLFIEYFFSGTRKDFVECQTVLDKEKPLSRRRGDGDGVFAECLAASTRQKIRQRVPLSGSLPSARATTLGKEPIPVPRSSFFAECYSPDTR